jgi:hypothetical protein
MLLNEEPSVEGVKFQIRNDANEGGFLSRLLRSNTTVAMFEHAVEADRVLAATIALSEVNGVWLWRSMDIATKPQEEWRHRPIVTRLTGTRMQERLLTQVVSELEKRDSVIVIHSTSGFDWRSTYSGAYHLMHQGILTFDFAQ